MALNQISLSLTVGLITLHKPVEALIKDLVLSLHNKVILVCVVEFKSSSSDVKEAKPLWWG
jgi:hypothetical protein